MKIEFDPQDIEAIAQKVAELVKPFLLSASRMRSEGGQEEFLSPAEAAALLKTTKAQIYQWANNAQHGLGDFPFLKAGRLLRFRRSDLIDWLEKSTKSL
jgi:excisionase family DNA binding protein